MVAMVISELKAVSRPKMFHVFRNRPLAPNKSDLEHT